MRPLQPMLISLACSSQISRAQIGGELSHSVGEIEGREEE